MGEIKSRIFWRKKLVIIIIIISVQDQLLLGVDLPALKDRLQDSQGPSRKKKKNVRANHSSHFTVTTKITGAVIISLKPKNNKIKHLQVDNDRSPLDRFLH